MPGSHETANRVHAAGVFVPVPLAPFTGPLLATKGIKSFVRLGPGQYRVVLEQVLGFHEGFCDATLPVNFQGVAGAQICPDASVLISVLAMASGVAVDPPFVNLKVWAVREGEGEGPVGVCPPAPPPLPSVGMCDDFRAADAIFPAAAPVPVGRNHHPLVPFPQGDSLVYFEGIMGCNWGEASVAMDIFWAAATATAGDVEWFVAWERENPVPSAFDLDADSFAPEKSVITTAPASSGQLRRASLTFTQAEAAGLKSGEPYRIRLRRDGGAGDDTMAGAAQFSRMAIAG